MRTDRTQHSDVGGGGEEANSGRVGGDYVRSGIETVLGHCVIPCCTVVLSFVTSSLRFPHQRDSQHASRQRASEPGRPSLCALAPGSRLGGATYFPGLVRRDMRRRHGMGVTHVWTAPVYQCARVSCPVATCKMEHSAVPYQLYRCTYEHRLRPVGQQNRRRLPSAINGQAQLPLQPRLGA
jgi:hypothetical protein